MIDEIRKWMPFTPSSKVPCPQVIPWSLDMGQQCCDRQVVCLGITYDCSEDAAREQFLEENVMTSSALPRVQCTMYTIHREWHVDLQTFQ